MLRRNLAVGAVPYFLQRAVSRQTFPPKLNGSFLHRRVEQIPTEGMAILHPEAPRLNQSLVFGLKHVQSSLFLFLRVSLHVLYQLRPRTKALNSLEEDEFETEIVTVRPTSCHTAHETHRVLNVFSREHIFSGVALTPRKASAVRGVSKYRALFS